MFVVGDHGDAFNIVVFHQGIVNKTILVAIGSSALSSFHVQDFQLTRNPCKLKWHTIVLLGNLTFQRRNLQNEFVVVSIDLGDQLKRLRLLAELNRQYS